jgi:hypothetical protein
MSDIVQFGSVPPVVVTTEAPSMESRATVALKATSILARDIFVQVSVTPQPGSQVDWFTIPDSSLRFQVKAGQSFEIPVTVKLPAGTPFDKYSFKLLAADDAAPQKDFTYSSPVIVERRPATSPPPSWWKWVAAGVGAVAVTIIVVLLVSRLGPSWRDACDPASPKCPSNGRCPAEVKKCLAPNRTACKSGETCLSGKCKDGVCASALLGDGCYPSESACEGNDRVGCLPGALKCGSFEGGPCRTAADCFDGACTKKDGTGPLVCGDAIKQEGCEVAKSADQCPADQECAVASNGKTLCLYKGGTVCPALHGGQGGQALCASQRCNDHARCAPSDGSCVANNHDCGPNNDCVGGHCRTPSGGPVRINIDWSTIRNAAAEVLIQKRATSERTFQLQSKRTAIPRAEP